MEDDAFSDGKVLLFVIFEGTRKIAVPSASGIPQRIFVL